MLSVNSHRHSFGVITLGHAALQLFISCFLGTAIHASLHDQLLVTESHRNLGAILGLHDFAADLIDSQILLTVLRSVSGFEASLLAHSFLCVCLLLQFLCDLSSNFSFNILRFLTDAGDLIRSVAARTVSIGSGHERRIETLTINSSVCVVKHFVSLNCVLKVQMLLRDVLSRDRSN